MQCRHPKGCSKFQAWEAGPANGGRSTGTEDTGDEPTWVEARSTRAGSTLEPSGHCCTVGVRVQWNILALEDSGRLRRKPKRAPSCRNCASEGVLDTLLLRVGMPGTPTKMLSETTDSL